MVEPPTAQRPHPPIWVAAASAPSIRRAAARGFNLILDQYAAPEAIGERIALYRAEREARGHTFDPMQVAVARQVYVAKNKADKEAALERLAKYTQRTVAVSRAPEVKGGAHVLAYADGAGGTETNALYGTADEICDKLQALNKAGAEYALLTIAGGRGSSCGVSRARSCRNFRARDRRCASSRRCRNERRDMDEGDFGYTLYIRKDLAMKVKVAKWGNSLAVRLPKHLAEELGLSPGKTVDLEKRGTKRLDRNRLRKIP